MTDVVLPSIPTWPNFRSVTNGAKDDPTLCIVQWPIFS